MTATDKNSTVVASAIDRDQRVKLGGRCITHWRTGGNRRTKAPKVANGKAPPPHAFIHTKEEEAALESGSPSLLTHSCIHLCYCCCQFDSLPPEEYHLPAHAFGFGPREPISFSDLCNGGRIVKKHQSPEKRREEVLLVLPFFLPSFRREGIQFPGRQQQRS